MHVVATAGHVDHGKSTLVRALTGIDPDRWAEEKERGLTIDLGFAWTTLPTGRTFSVVDVPGHVRFLKNMLAGVGAVDAAVMVVDAREGWMPQTEEHLRILEVLGLRHGLVALTKADTVDADTLELAALEIDDRVTSTFLAGAPIVPVDSISGRGLDDLVAALDSLLADTPRSVDHGRPRLWVDRVFAAKGSGTVLTGTLLGGPIAVDDHLALAPSGIEVRVRGLQAHQRSVDRCEPGSRLAVNVSGAAVDDVARGDALVHPDQWHLTRVVDARLEVLAALDHEVGRKGAYHCHVGSGEQPVRLRLLGGVESLAPGSAGPVRLHLSAALPLLPGDRFVLREAGRDETVGGGEVLDVDPVLPATRARPDRSVERVIAERGWVEVDQLERLTGERRPADVGTWLVAPEALAATRAEVTELLEGAGELGLDVAVLDDRQRTVLATLDEVVVADGRARRADAADLLGDHPWLAALAASPFSPPGPEGVDPAEVRELVRRGLVVERDGVHFAAGAIDGAARLIAGVLARQPEGVTVSEVRTLLATSRKYALPLLAVLDATGVTRRRGDLRIAGPRLPS